MASQLLQLAVEEAQVVVASQILQLAVEEAQLAGFPWFPGISMDIHVASQVLQLEVEEAQLAVAISQLPLREVAQQT